MLFNRQLQGFLVIGLLFCLGLLFLDYYLLVFYEGDIGEKGMKALGMLEKGLTFLKIGFLASYVMLLYLSLSMTRYEKPKKKREIVEFPMWVQVVGLVMAVTGALWFINFERSGLNFEFFYPISFLMYFIGLPMAKFILPKKHTSFVKRPRINNADSISYPTVGKGYINNVEPFRHTLVVAGSGSGKSGSVVRRTIISNVEKGFCGIQFDYKYPVLTNELHTVLVNRGRKSSYPLYILDFENVKKSNRINLLEPRYLKNINYAEEIATVLINNLDKSTIKNPDGFFTGSAINWLTATIYFFKKNHPNQCTLPHILCAILYDDYKHVFSMLRSEPECDDRIRSIVTSLDTGAERQLAGQVATLQNSVSKLNTPEMAWRLSKSDFSLNINDPENPVHLSIGMNTEIRKSLGAIVSSIFTVALQQMNVANKHKSYLMLDEAASIYLNDLDHLAAVARDNKVAITVILQELAMYRDQYGADKAESIIGNLNNIFFGRVNTTRTAQMVSQNIGNEPREVIFKGESVNLMKSDSANLNQNYQVMDKPIVRPNEVLAFKKGEFVGRTTDEKQDYYHVRFKEKKFRRIHKVEEFVEFFGKEDGLPLDQEGIDKMLAEHFEQIRDEVETIITGYKNIYEDAGETQPHHAA